MDLTSFSVDLPETVVAHLVHQTVEENGISLDMTKDFLETILLYLSAKFHTNTVRYIINFEKI